MRSDLPYSGRHTSDPHCIFAAARVALTQLRRIPKGDTIEEDHQRDRQLIVRYIMDKTGATYRMVRSYEKMRAGVGMLLAELMRIKAEGDYAAIKALVDRYGVRFDPALRDQVVERYKRLNLPVYWAGINPALTAAFGKPGEAIRVDMRYPRSAVEQYLSYASMYDPSLAGSLPKAAAPQAGQK